VNAAFTRYRGKPGEEIRNIRNYLRARRPKAAGGLNAVFIERGGKSRKQVRGIFTNTGAPVAVQVGRAIWGINADTIERAGAGGRIGICRG
jgi:hypothetical protein